MSEPIPESIPTSADPRSHRPLKRRALTPSSAQANQVEALFAKPDLSIPLPSSTIAKQNGRPVVPPPPEIVANVQGSSAGAGSGEFHVYKASRRREYERLRQMEEDVSKEKADEEYERRVEEMRKRDEEKTGKNRRRREKKKAGKKVKGDEEVEMGKEREFSGTNGIKKLGPVVLPRNGPDGDDDRQEEEVAGKSVEDVGIVIHDDD
ncbi:MAG: hypothetical protein LQ350_003367 [Teloschistes chrysophthalmus]|nr:MAG: hypothetical protein LQ350_003367 [Niorma chrysophthalma]